MNLNARILKMYNIGDVGEICLNHALTTLCVRTLGVVKWNFFFQINFYCGFLDILDIKIKKNSISASTASTSISAGLSNFWPPPNKSWTMKFLNSAMIYIKPIPICLTVSNQLKFLKYLDFWRNYSLLDILASRPKI